MRNPAWVNVVAGAPIVGDFSSTRGQGTPIVINEATDIPYYLKTGDIITPLAGSGSGSAILEIDGGTASNTGTPYLEIDGGSA